MPAPPDNAAIRWGLAFEDAVIKLAEERENLNILDREGLFQSVQKNITLSCHIDGAFGYNGYIDSATIHEGKTTNHWAYTSTRKEIIEKLGHDGQLENGFNIVRRWGDPGTDQVPQEYQIQAAVQRICTGAELVKLSVLVFPKAQQDYEDMGWITTPSDCGEYMLGMMADPSSEYMWKKQVSPQLWANTIADMGGFHTYLLPSHPELEQAIIESVARFDRHHLKPGIPPDATDFADVRRLLPNPLGTVIATPDLVTLCKEYSENVRQLGTASPIRARQEKLKPEIMNLANALRRSDPTNPTDKFLILDPDGGDKLATVGKDKNGVISFRAARAG